MQSKRAKGNALQDWIAKWLVENHPGCSVHNQKTVSKAIPMKGKIVWTSARQDILGCIDLIMVSDSDKPWFIQATCHTGIGKKLDDLLKVSWNLDHARVFVWQKKEPRLHLIRELQYKWEDCDEPYPTTMGAGRWMVPTKKQKPELVTIAEIRNGKWIDVKET